MATVREDMMIEKVEDELSIVARKDPRELAAVLQKIGAFQELAKTQLQEGRDYGAIPGAGDRKVLLKPGAEKITVLLGLRSKFEIAGKVEDFEAGFFAYMVRCSLVSANGETITEGLGQANTKEKKYSKQDPYTLANTVLKMARKRALVDAALTVGSLSDIFTQDLEDADLAAAVRESQQPMLHAERMATENQRKAIFAISRKAGMTDEMIRSVLNDKYGVSSTADLMMEQASELIDILDENLKQAVNAK